MKKNRQADYSSLKAQLQPRLIRASAGTGKTFELARRYLTLLVAGEEPERILATTFTRKAAGEIQERIYQILAKTVLSDSPAIDIDGFDVGKAGELLIRLVKQQHRLGICTLDSFFVKLSTSFSLEMELPVGWRISDQTLNQEISTEAIASVLRDSDFSKLRTLLNLLSQGEARRAVQDRLDRDIPSLYELFRSSSSAAWHEFVPPESPAKDNLREALEQLEKLQSCETGRLSVAIRDALLAFRSGDWKDFVSKGIAKLILNGKDTYYRKPLDPGLLSIFKLLLQECRAVWLGQLYKQTTATYSLLKLYDQAYRALRKETKTISFDDLKCLLAFSSVKGELDELYYRLDQRISHLLLDEFQDTSAMQWRVLEPLADEILAKASGEYSFFCVGDVKQAIYGWRGGIAEIFDSLESRWPQLEVEHKDASYRCAPAVLDAVNQVFTNLATNDILSRYPRVTEVWQSRFNRHESVNRESPGYATMIEVPKEAVGSHDAVFNKAALLVKSLAENNQHITIGILCRSNKSVAKMIYELGRQEIGIKASEEGGNPLVDSPAVMVILSLLKLIDHPGDQIAAFHVATSPLGAVLGLSSFNNQAEINNLITYWRNQLIRDGFGVTISKWRDVLRGYYSDRDQHRLEQLIELTLLVESDLHLRCGDLIRRVQTMRVEDPSTARIRVMTVHQAKGLEFSAVVLPEIDVPLTGVGYDPVLTSASHPLEPPQRIVSSGSRELRQLDPALQQMYEQAKAGRISEALSVLYVAMTRAKHALYMLCTTERDNKASFSNFIRKGLSSDQEECSYECGNPEWWQMLPNDHRGADVMASSHKSMEKIQLAPVNEDIWRNIPRQTPSGLEAEGKVQLGQLFNLRFSGARDYGTLIHACFEAVQWLQDESPIDRGELLRFLGSKFLRVTKDRLLEVIERFQGILSQPEMRSFLKQNHYSYFESDQLKVTTEYQFAFRRDRTVFTGSCDRVVVGYRAGKPCAAEIIDFKTDQIAGNHGGIVKEKRNIYTQQMAAYRQAVSRLTGLASEGISAKLLFVEANIVVEV